MTRQLDLTHMRCPRSLVEAKLVIKALNKGDSIQIIGGNKQLFDDLIKIKSTLAFSITTSNDFIQITKK